MWLADSELPEGQSYRGLRLEVACVSIIDGMEEPLMGLGERQ